MTTTSKIIGAILTIAIIFIAYQSFVAIPKQRIEAAAAQARLEIAEKKQAEELRLARYEECRQTAWNSYSLNWDNECKALGLGKDCSLPQFKADNLDDSKTKAIDHCIALYK